MNHVNERDHLAELSGAVAAYLAAMRSAGECVTNACPGVGEPFGQRILKLQARLAFDPTRESIHQSVGVLSTELKDFAIKASTHNQQLAMEVRRAMAAIERGVDALERSTRSFSSLASRLDNTPSTDAMHSHLGSFTQEIDVLLQELRQEAHGVETRLTEGHVTDPVTGLMNRDEVMRRIDVLRANDVTHTLIVLEVGSPGGGAVPSTVLRQAVTKLAMQFRYQDLLARWGQNEFLVVFQGVPELALFRTGQAVDQVSGRYQSPGGGAIDLALTARVEQAQLAAA